MQTNKIVTIVIGIVLVVAIGAFAFMQARPSGQAQPTESPAMSTSPLPTESSGPMMSETPAPGTKTPTPSPSGSARYTMAQIAMHHTSSDCWTTINGGVYNLTSWIPQHPGGQQAIIQLCGKDGSAAFNAQHGGMQQQAAVLATFKIGVLAQ